jgi:ADP-ribosyl-[dinitrogen reductase] hydrolase
MSSVCKNQLSRLLGCLKDEVLLGDADSFIGGERVTAIARGSYSSKSEKEIQGTGYVVQSLARTRNFAAAILMAANFGDDADTTAAVCGQVANTFALVGAIGASFGDHETGYSAQH